MKPEEEAAEHPDAPEVPSFEAMMGRLEEIVAMLERGDLPLERSLALFEEGMGLTRVGLQKLDDAERRVQLLVREGEQAVPFESGD